LSRQTQHYWAQLRDSNTRQAQLQKQQAEELAQKKHAKESKAQGKLSQVHDKHQFICIQDR